jgi:hypothetical protein
MGTGGAVRGFGAAALGLRTPEQYWEGTLGATAELFAAANRLPPPSRLIAVNEARRYPFRWPVALASVFDRSPIRPAVAGAADAETIRRRLVQAGYTHLLVNEFEQDRILRMHPPPRLWLDAEFTRLREAGDPLELARRYGGMTEFATDPLSPAEREIYLRFLGQMRRRAIWRWGLVPAMWIAPLGEADQSHGNLR